MLREAPHGEAPGHSLRGASRGLFTRRLEEASVLGGSPSGEVTGSTVPIPCTSPRWRAGSPAAPQGARTRARCAASVVYHCSGPLGSTRPSLPGTGRGSPSGGPRRSSSDDGPLRWSRLGDGGPGRRRTLRGSTLPPALLRGCGQGSLLSALRRRMGTDRGQGARGGHELLRETRRCRPWTTFPRGGDRVGDFEGHHAPHFRGESWTTGGTSSTAPASAGTHGASASSVPL